MWKNWRLVFRELFCVSMQIAFLVFDALTEEIHTFFCSKNFYFLHFSIFLSGGNFQMWKNWALVFRELFSFSCKSGF
jgi:hypothetical protein